jgi:Glycosyl hydrolases family 18.
MAILSVVLVLVGFAVDTVTYQQLNPPGAKSFNTGNNGIWLKYLWYFGKKSQPETDALVAKLEENQIKYAFFHVRKTDAKGNLVFKYKSNAQKLTAEMHSRLPQMKVIAWVYVPSPVFNRDGVDLADPQVRNNLVSEAVWLINDCGFDGVQWDYEVFPNNEKNFPALLDETRAAIGPDKFLSVATPMLHEEKLYCWDEAHFTDIAEHCDQIAIMCYDSFLYYPRAYVQLVSKQACRVSAAVNRAGNHRCKLLLGIPVYDTDKGTPGHLTIAENITNALKGVREGLALPEAVPAVFEGVAPFAEYTMDDSEWAQYRKWWLENH